MNKSTYQIHYKLHPVHFADKREISRPRSTKLFTLPVPPVQPTYTEAFSRKVLPKQSSINVFEPRKLYLRIPVNVIQDTGDVKISPDDIVQKERGRGPAACLLGAMDLGIGLVNNGTSTYQEDYRGLKPDCVEFESMDAALKKLAQPADNYTLDSLQRLSYKGEEQSMCLLEQNTTRYGCNKNKSIPATAALPSIKLLKKKYGLDYKRTSYQDSYKLPKLCQVDNCIKGLELHPVGPKGMEISGNELLTRKFLNRAKTCRSTKFNTESATQSHMDITMDWTNMNNVATVI